MISITDFIKDADSILDTLNKDYEIMQAHRSSVRQDQEDKLNTLCENMGEVLKLYSKTIYDFKSKIERNSDSHGIAVTVYTYPDIDRKITFTPVLYWNHHTPCYCIEIKECTLDDKPFNNTENIIVSETDIESLSAGFDKDKRYSTVISTFLNHCPSYTQLEEAFQSALVEYIMYCVTSTQKRNEYMADKIKSITK